MGWLFSLGYSCLHASSIDSSKFWEPCNNFQDLSISILTAAELNQFINTLSLSAAKKMEAASAIVGLTAAIQQLLTTVYQFEQGVLEAKTETNQLCSELLALKAALDHVQLNLNAGLTGFFGDAEDAQSILSSFNFSTSEFKDMISYTSECLKGLLARLNHRPSKFKIPLNRATWQLVKGEVKVRYRTA